MPKELDMDVPVHDMVTLIRHFVKPRTQALTTAIAIAIMGQVVHHLEIDWDSGVRLARRGVCFEVENVSILRWATPASLEPIDPVHTPFQYPAQYGLTARNRYPLLSAGK